MGTVHRDLVAVVLADTSFADRLPQLLFEIMKIVKFLSSIVEIDEDRVFIAT